MSRKQTYGEDRRLKDGFQFTNRVFFDSLTQKLLIQATHG
jgi:hypothetical protein